MIKPLYRIPSMKEIEEIPWNGFNVVSTFSGCGGSSLGYKMTGYKVLWANEFIPEAQNTYRANHPQTFLDPRDIREIKAHEILEKIGLKRGELDLFDGSPPCAAFSSCGKREAGWGIVKKYSDTEQRVDDLFFEYTRLLKGLMPRTFIAENVAGLVKGKAKGYFKLILQELKSCGYKVKAQILNAKFLGVPQARERLIFIGVRNDLGLEPVFPKPFPFSYTLRDAIPEGEIKGIAYNLKAGKMRTLYLEAKAGEDFGMASERLFGKRSSFNHKKAHWDRASMTVVQGSQSIYHPERPRSLTIPELKRISSFPDDFELTGSFSQQWERIGRAVPPLMMSAISKTVQEEILWKIRS